MKKLAWVIFALSVLALAGRWFEGNRQALVILAVIAYGSFIAGLIAPNKKINKAAGKQ